MAAPQAAAGVSAKPGSSIAEAARIAAPSPSRARFGTRSGRERPSSARPSAQATAMWPRVFGALVAEGAGVGGAAAADRVEDEEEGARHQAIRWWTSGPSSGGALVQPVGGADAGDGGLERGLAAGVDAGERRVGLDDGAEADQALEPDGMVDGVGRPPAPAAELDHREAEAAGVDAGDEAVAPGGDVGDQRRAGEMRLEAVEEPGRAAERRDHAVETLGGGARLEGHRHPLGAVGLVGGDAAEHQELGPERDGHVPEPAVDDVAAQEAGGVRHLERVAGGGRQRLVHVGDQRPGAAAGAVRHLRSGSRRARGRRRASP